MERQDFHVAKAKGQTPVGGGHLQDSLLGICSLGSSIQESEGSQMSLEESSQTQREVQKPTQRNPQRGKLNREGHSSTDSSQLAPDNWRKDSTVGDEDEAYFSRASISIPFQDLSGFPQAPQIPRSRESADENKHSEEYNESFMGSRDATHRAYWAELQNRLPLPLANLMEEEALEILTKSLRSYNKGIGKDHKLTQQLQRHVDQLRKNLQGRRFT